MNIEKAIHTIYTRRPVRIALHILFWTAMFGIQKYMTTISFNNFKSFPEPQLTLLLISGPLRLMIFFYPFVYWILPRFLYRKRFIMGFVLTLLLAIVHAFTDTLAEELFIHCPACMESIQASNTGYAGFLQKDLIGRLIPKVLSMGNFIGLLFNIALPICIKLGLQALRQQFRAMQLAKENLQLEFNFLRSQVNPHFLFNTLNNVYGLILKNDNEKSAATVARLSQFLRYSLYESNAEQVPVEKEIQLLKDYVELESLRLNHIHVQFNHNIDGSVATMAPLLLMPYIENSFKHTKDVPDAYITIDLRIANKHIYFNVANTLDVQPDAVIAGGIGLGNVKKRLDLYYPGRYSYKVNPTLTEYAVSINIDCHE